MITIDGSFGEGGGQVLRTSLGLSMLTGKPFHIYNIRAGRKKPGLLNQHLTCVRAAAEICGADVRGAALRSPQVFFEPGPVQPGEYRFAVRTAGSAALVLQAVLPGLLTAEGPTTLHLEGGTHNKAAPNVDFLDQAFLPLIRQLGPGVRVSLERHGFYPAGGGRFRVAIKPVDKLRQLELMDRGREQRRRAVALVSNLPRDIAVDEARMVANKLGLPKGAGTAEQVESDGPGNAVMLFAEFENVTEVFTGFGDRGLPRKAVVEQVLRQARPYLGSNAAVGQHLADQLLIPLAMAGGGRFSTVEPSAHTRTNIAVIGRFLDVPIECVVDAGRWQVRTRTESRLA